MNLRDELAVLSQEILLTNHRSGFGNSWKLLENRRGLKIPQPGFVGSRYRRGGVIFLGNNPGKGGLVESEERS